MCCNLRALCPEQGRLGFQTIFEIFLKSVFLALLTSNSLSKNSFSFDYYPHVYYWILFMLFHTKKPQRNFQNILLSRFSYIKEIKYERKIWNEKHREANSGWMVLSRSRCCFTQYSWKEHYSARELFSFCKMTHFLPMSNLKIYLLCVRIGSLIQR